MAGWTQHSGLALALDRENVDTDQLIPARFMMTPRATGYGRFLLHDLRFAPDGSAVADAPLNQHPSATVLVTGRNFGSGSSREAAVYALVDFGIRVVVAPSFGDIFAANAVNNGLLPARAETEPLLTALRDGPLPAAADLTAQMLTIGDHNTAFDIDPAWRDKLIQGWDDIDLTQAHAAQIEAFRAAHAAKMPWAFIQQEQPQNQDRAVHARITSGPIQGHGTTRRPLL